MIFVKELQDTARLKCDRFSRRMDTQKTPIETIGIIMDGNRRWARAHGRMTHEGHVAGMETLRTLAREVERAGDVFGIKNVILYAFSEENWNRTKEEVDQLLALLEQAVAEIKSELQKDSSLSKKVRLRMIGDRSRIPSTLVTAIEEIERTTEGSNKLTIAIALSYGGRTEIVSAVNKLIGAGHSAITEEMISSTVWTEGIPDPDLIIRTSGEQRLSGFLTWQSVYSELYFTPTLWPDFTYAELEKILTEHQSRERRYGT